MGAIIKKLIGKKVILGPLLKKNLEKYVHWLNDMEVSHYLTIAPINLTMENESEWYEKVVSDRSKIVFSIYDRKKEILIGNVSLENINHLDRSAELGIFIGYKKYWGRGYGSEAIELILDFGFNVLNLNSIFLKVYSYNKRAIKSYEKIGFKHAGILRQAKIFCGKKYDVVIMDILASEFKGHYIEEIMKKSR